LLLHAKPNVKHFNVVVPKSDGAVELHPMKQWLRQNAEHIPPGLDATTSTSHQLRSGLRRMGWVTQETATEVRLIPPGSGDAVIDAVLGDPDETENEEPSETAFGLEYQLRDFIAQNIGAIDVQGKRLKLYVDPTGRDGVEFPTAVGPIDILAVDEIGAFYVFELKRARSPDHAMGQLTRYMGWVKNTIGRDRAVHGIIVAKTISQSLRYAIGVIPHVDLFEYEVEFHLRPAQAIS
jgi:endonuclease